VEQITPSKDKNCISDFEYLMENSKGQCTVVQQCEKYIIVRESIVNDASCMFGGRPKVTFYLYEGNGNHFNCSPDITDIYELIEKRLA
jgi:hypothetical protein